MIIFLKCQNFVIRKGLSEITVQGKSKIYFKVSNLIIGLDLSQFLTPYPPLSAPPFCFQQIRLNIMVSTSIYHYSSFKTNQR